MDEEVEEGRVSSEGVEDPTEEEGDGVPVPSPMGEEVDVRELYIYRVT